MKNNGILSVKLWDIIVISNRWV